MHAYSHRHTHTIAPHQVGRQYLINKFNKLIYYASGRICQHLYILEYGFALRVYVFTSGFRCLRVCARACVSVFACVFVCKSVCVCVCVSVSVSQNEPNKPSDG